MNSLAPLGDAIAASFGNGEPPAANQLVVRDGFDELDKEAALRFYSGRTWQEVLGHLRGLERADVFRGAYFLEEWSVLAPRALAYHARGHLEFLLETLAREVPDEEYVFYFLGQLGQLLHMFGRLPFDPAQAAVVRRLVEHIAARCRESLVFEYFAASIEEQAANLVTALDQTAAPGVRGE